MGLGLPFTFATIKSGQPFAVRLQHRFEILTVHLHSRLTNRYYKMLLPIFSSAIWPLHLSSFHSIDSSTLVDSVSVWCCIMQYFLLLLF